MRKKQRKLSKAELLNRQIEGWERKQEGAVIMLRKSAEMLLDLRRQRRRMLERETKKALAARPDEGQRFGPDEAIKSPTDVRPPKTDDDWPSFLDRPGKDKDAAARAEIEAEQAEQKKAKADRRIKKLKIGQETKHAELTGQRRKMPLTGKAALDAINKKEPPAAGQQPGETGN